MLFHFRYSGCSPIVHIFRFFLLLFLPAFIQFSVVLHFFPFSASFVVVVVSFSRSRFYPVLSGAIVSSSSSPPQVPKKKKNIILSKYSILTESRATQTLFLPRSLLARMPNPTPPAAQILLGFFFFFPSFLPSRNPSMHDRRPKRTPAIDLSAEASGIIWRPGPGRCSTTLSNGVVALLTATCTGGCCWDAGMLWKDQFSQDGSDSQFVSPTAGVSTAVMMFICEGRMPSGLGTSLSASSPAPSLTTDEVGSRGLP